jgi:hypothetical protein
MTNHIDHLGVEGQGNAMPSREVRIAESGVTHHPEGLSILDQPHHGGTRIE